MGGVLSTQKLTAPVTINRMRYACQRDSALPYNVRRHHVMLLANDLNKLGFKITIKDSGGKPMSIDKMCDNISNAIPNAQSVCMISNENKGNIHEALKKIVHYFNKNYGANIRMYKNEFGPKNKENLRKYEDVCDDLYMVEDRIHRQLTDSTNFVKRNLLQNIALLRQYRTQLANDFQQYFSKLQNGRQLDQVNRKMRGAQVLRQALLGEIDKQLSVSNSGYKDLIMAYEKQVNPLLGTASIHLQNYRGLPFGWGSVGTMKGGANGDLLKAFGKKLENLFVPSIALGQAAERCMKCVQKFGMTVDEFNNSNKNLIRDKVRRNAMKALSEAARSGDSRNVTRIQACMRSLLTDDHYVDECKRAIKGNSGYVQAQRRLNPGHCLELSSSEEVCLKDPSCLWNKQKSACVPMENKDVLDQISNAWQNRLDQLQKANIVPNVLQLNNIANPMMEQLLKPQVGVPSLMVNTIGIPQSIDMVTHGPVMGGKKRRRRKKKASKKRSNKKKRSSKKKRRSKKKASKKRGKK